MELSRLLVLATVIVVSAFAQDERTFNLTVSECRGKEADIFFLLDSSTSIFREDYDFQLQFLREVIKRLDISSQFTRVGALTYSDNYHVAFNLGDYSTKYALINAVNSRNMPQVTGSTNTADAIRYARSNRLFRSEVVRVIVVITDGDSNRPASTSQESQIAKREGFYMFVIGVGQEFRESELSSDPDNSFMFTVNNYGALDVLYNTIPVEICLLRPVP